MTKAKQFYFKTAKFVQTGEYVAVKYLGTESDEFQVTFQDGHICFCKAAYLSDFCL